jgi:hypothetical protein
MDLKRLFTGRDRLYLLPEKTFVLMPFDIGVSNAVVFVANRQMTRDATHYSLLSPLGEQNYDINIVTADSAVLMYIISIKAPYHSVYSNGLIIRNRKKWSDSDIQGVEPRYSFADAFEVITNKNQTAAVFCRNRTSEQKT